MLSRPGSERIQKTDPRTGIKVIQATAYPIQSVPLDYAWTSVTPDNKSFLFATQRYGGRNAPWDLFRCDMDGVNMIQLTERDHEGLPWHHGVPKAALTVDGAWVYAVWPGEDIVCKVDMETRGIEELADLSAHISPGYHICALRISTGDRRLFVDARSYEHGDAFALRLDLRTGELARICEGDGVSACFPDSERILVQTNFRKLDTEVTADGTRKYSGARQAEVRFESRDEDGGDARDICANTFAHSTLLGKIGKIQGTGLPPERCIWIAEEGREPYKLAEGRYFWHSSASYDGEWIIADTNWPDEGLHLIHVPTGRHRLLCHARSAQEHSQFTHPHPVLSRDGRFAIFGSDRTGMSQVYVAYITDEFRESVIAGELDRPKDKWI